MGLSFLASCSLPGFICIFALHVHELQSAPFTVTAPTHPVAVAVGQDVVLPCRLTPEQSARAMEVTWFRGHFSHFVHRYKAGTDQHGEQMSQYQGRTELLRDGLDNGSVDLKIFSVRLSDEGNYTCFVHADSGYEEAVLELKVTAAGSAPLISLEGYEAGGVRVACRGAGWYPQPQVQWRDHRGRPLPSTSENVTQDASGLFEAKSTVILSWAANQQLSCSIRDALHHHEKGSAFSMADPFFQNAHPWKIALNLVAVAVVALFISTIYLFKMKGKHEGKIAMQVAALRACDAEIKEKVAQLVKVILDPDTAHCDLVLSNDRKSVKREDTPQNVPDIPERFMPWRCVLGCEGFTSGRYYWEVEVVDGGGWTVGVSREDVRRKGEIEFKPEEGIWAVGQWAGRFQALTSPQRTFLSEIQGPKRIRVSLDYEEGRVAFFNVDTETPVFTFPLVSFDGKRIHPWVWLGPGTWLKMVP
ncbi:butyrophilin subfamily 1 member A1-like isoform X2 [Apteryx mantelli]|uniref:Butyrophilin subfamily 1 member A1-like isoform X2 n=1 Tax=Apteryx mantelli TaxID=2696672 RepID=A0ABM4FYK1_9AVES